MNSDNIPDSELLGRDQKAYNYDTYAFKTVSTADGSFAGVGMVLTKH
jgi:hypothetical protein